MSSFEPLSTNLSGRLKKINLSQSDCLLPIFECVVNSIQSIEERAEQDENFKIAEGRITVEFVYDESQLPIEEGSSCPVVGFRVTDNGCGFNTKNFNSFKTFDSEYKAAKGCKGVGRLQWLKEFDEAMITSTFLEQGKPQTNNFRFTKDGIELIHAVQQTTQTYSTTVFLKNLQKPYFDKVQQQSADFAGHLLNHIIWYYLDPERHPQILVKTKGLTLDLSNKFNEINEKDISRGSFTENGIDFTIYHLKIRNNGINQALLSLAANNRAVKQKNVRSSLGISQTLKDQNGDFSYLAFVTSSYLDSIVNSDRTELNFAQSSSEASLFSSEITEKDFNNAVMAQVKEFLKDFDNLAII